MMVHRCDRFWPRDRQDMTRYSVNSQKSIPAFNWRPPSLHPPLSLSRSIHHPLSPVTRSPSSASVLFSFYFLISPLLPSLSISLSCLLCVLSFLIIIIFSPVFSSSPSLSAGPLLILSIALSFELHQYFLVSVSLPPSLFHLAFSFVYPSLPL